MKTAVLIVGATFVVSTPAAKSNSTNSLSASSISSISSSSSSSSSASHTIGGLILQGLAASSISQDSVSQCQSSQVSWSEAYTKAIQPSVTTLTSTATFQQTVLTEDYIYGSADIYTTSDGIPRAHDTLKATSTSQFVGPWSDTTVFTYTSTITKDTPFNNPSPSCTIDTSTCSSLWQSYFASLGLPTAPLQNRTEPVITPVPTNRPRCSIGPVDNVCTTNTKQHLCGLSASKINVFYWPPMTAAASNSGPVTAIYQNMTFTSPSVYLRFDTLDTISSADLYPTCTVTSPLGATGPPPGLVGGQTIGGPSPNGLTSALVSLQPSDVTSLIRDLGPGINTASVVSEIAHHGPSYSYWFNAVAGTGFNAPFGGTPQGFGTSVTSRQVDFRDLAQPRPEAYYLNINTAFGCHRVGPQDPNCGIIFDGAYRAQLQVPPQVRTLKPEWADCGDALFGAYDPPISLQAVANIASPTVPGGGAVSASSTPAASNQPTQPLPGSSIPPTTGPTTSPVSPGSGLPPPSQPDNLSPSSGSASPPSSNPPSSSPIVVNPANPGSPAPGSPSQDPGNQNSPAPAPPGQSPASSAPSSPASPNISSSPNGMPTQGGAGSLSVSQISGGVFVVGSSTVSAGGPAAVVSGHTVSAATSGLVIDGSSVGVGNAPTTVAVGTSSSGAPTSSSNIAPSATNGGGLASSGSTLPAGGGVTSGTGSSDVRFSAVYMSIWTIMALAGIL